MTTIATLTCTGDDLGVASQDAYDLVRGHIGPGYDTIVHEALSGALYAVTGWTGNVGARVLIHVTD